MVQCIRAPAHVALDTEWGIRVETSCHNVYASCRAAFGAAPSTTLCGCVRALIEGRRGKCSADVDGWRCPWFGTDAEATAATRALVDASLPLMLYGLKPWTTIDARATSDFHAIIGRWGEGKSCLQNAHAFQEKIRQTVFTITRAATTVKLVFAAACLGAQIGSVQALWSLVKIGEPITWLSWLWWIMPMVGDAHEIIRLFDRFQLRSGRGIYRMRLAVLHGHIELMRYLVVTYHVTVENFNVACEVFLAARRPQCSPFDVISKSIDAQSLLGATLFAALFVEQQNIFDACVRDVGGPSWLVSEGDILWKKWRLACACNAEVSYGEGHTFARANVDKSYDVVRANFDPHSVDARRDKLMAFLWAKRQRSVIANTVIDRVMVPTLNDIEREEYCRARAGCGSMYTDGEYWICPRFLPPHARADALEVVPKPPIRSNAFASIVHDSDNCVKWAVIPRGKYASFDETRPFCAPASVIARRPVVFGQHTRVHRPFV